jgi:putative hydrolase of the HAD superfamily
MTLRAVIFDRDGVLSRFDLEGAALFFAPRVPLSLWEISDRWEAWGARVGFPRSIAEETQFFRGFWNALCDDLGLDAAVRADLLDLDYTRYVVAFPDVRPALVAVRAAGLAVGVLSNFSLASLDASLESMGIDELVDAACAATVIGAAKPDPRAYRIAAARLGVDATECLFLDDEEVCVTGARAVGMAALRVDRTRQTHALDQGVVADLSVLPALLTSVGR